MPLTKPIPIVISNIYWTCFILLLCQTTALGHKEEFYILSYVTFIITFSICVLRCMFRKLMEISQKLKEFIGKDEDSDLK